MARPVVSKFVFATNNGTPYRARNLMRDFGRVLDRAGLHCTFHDLRRSCASLLLSSGYDLRAVADLLGHSDARLTLQIYTKSTDAKQRQMAEGMAEILSLPGKQGERKAKVAG